MNKKGLTITFTESSLGCIVKFTYLYNYKTILLFQITNSPVFSLSKKGKDNLVVRSSEIHMKRMDTGAETKYNCGGFELKGDCKDASFCTKTFTNCQKSVVSAGKA